MKPSVLRVPINATKIVAMWPLNTKNKTILFLMRVYLMISASSLAICSIGLGMKIFKTNDLVDRSEAIDIFTLTFSALYKQIFFVQHNTELNYLARCADRFDVPEGWMKNAPYYAVIHCVSAFLSLAFWWLTPCIKSIFGETTIAEMILPINVYLPFRLHGWQFVLAYIYSSFGLSTSAQVYMSIDTFLWTSIHAANGALHKLAEKLKSLRHMTDDKTKFNELKECIDTHNFIIEFLNNLDRLFRSLIVADILHAIVSLSFAMLQTSEAKGVFEWAKMIIFVICCFLHQYLNSFFGQALINKQEELRIALFDTPWEHDKKVGTTICSMMIMASKPIRLSAWRMYFLQYPTFTEFVKSMISTFMVLRQLQDKAIETGSY